METRNARDTRSWIRSEFPLRRVSQIGGRTTEIGNAAQSWSERRGHLLTLRSEAGVVGRGEASPLPGHSDESFDQVARELAELSEAINSRGELIAAVDPPLSSSAQLALDSAASELCAKTLQTSVAQLIGARAPRPVAASQLIDIRGDGSALESGIRCVKFKVGPFSAWKRQRKAIDRFVAKHPSVSIRFDFNSTLEVSEAVAVAAQLQSASWLAALDYVEDPGTDLAAWTTSWPCPLAVDELVASASSDRQALANAQQRGARVAILKPALCGGLHATLKRAELLSNHGIEPVISHLLDGPVALAAYAELACSIAALRKRPRAAAIGPHRGLVAFGERSFPNLCDGVLRPIVHPCRVKQ